jgi:hypothetical protein
MALTSSIFIDGRSLIDTTSHPDGRGGWVNVLRYDGLTIYLTGDFDADDEDAGSIAACDNLILAVKKLRRVIAARRTPRVKEAVPA